MAKAYTLVGVDGNAFSIMGYVTVAMKRAGYSKEERDAYIAEATSGNYDNLLVISMDMIDKVNDALGLSDDEEDD